jgi:hypothetical protein
MVSRLATLTSIVLTAQPAWADEKSESFARQARAVLKQHCFHCHHGEGSAYGEFSV